MEAKFDYASGHHNSPGRYFLELPLYLLPWTILAAYALEAAWRGARRASARRAAWRFALCVAFPGLLVLSLATTARSIYAAPCMIGFALLMALAIERLALDTAAARRVLVGTAVLLLLLAFAVLGAQRRTAMVAVARALAAVSPELMHRGSRRRLVRRASVSLRDQRARRASRCLRSCRSLQSPGACCCRWAC